MYGGRLLRVHAQTLADLSNFACKAWLSCHCSCPHRCDLSDTTVFSMHRTSPHAQVDMRAACLVRMVTHVGLCGCVVVCTDDPDALNQTTDEPKAKQARTPGRSSPGSKGKAEQPDAAVAPDTNHPQAAAVTSPVTSPVVTSPMTSPDSAAKALEDQPAPEDFASIGATITEREGGQAEGGQAEGGQADAGAAGQPTGSPPAQGTLTCTACDWYQS